MQADAMNLKPNYAGYDLIVVPALLEELSDPGLFLSQIHTRLNDGGLLLLASDYDWNPIKTKRDKWPGGFKQDGEPVTSLEGITKILEIHFSLQADPLEIKRLQKKSSRHTAQQMLQVTIWKKR